MLNFGTRASRFCLGAAAVIVAATPALANHEIDVVAGPAVSRIVKISDLNLANADDLARAHRRVSFAAQDVCGATRTYDLINTVDYLNCRSTTIKAARVQLEQRLAANSAAPLRVTAG